MFLFVLGILVVLGGGSFFLGANDMILLISSTQFSTIDVVLSISTKNY